MKLQFEVEDWVVSQVEELKEATGSADYKELFNNAFALLTWAIQERTSGRTVASIDEDGKQFQRLRMPALEYAAFISGRHLPNLKAA
jgi:hypothetical protein